MFSPVPSDVAALADGHQTIEVMIPPSEHVVTQRTFLYEPSERDIVVYKQPKTRTGRLRKIFLNTPLDDEEQRWLSNLRTHLQREELQFHPMLEKDFLRYLQHAKGNVEATVKLLQANEVFRQKFLVSLKDTDIMGALQSGFMYWHGRDRNERPILVVRTAKLDTKMKPGDIVRLVGFILEWMIMHGLVPGRVENWTVLVDVKDTSLKSLSIDAVRTLVTTLHMNYRFRNTKVVIMHCPWIGTTIYKMISPLLPADSKEKVTFCSSVKEAQNVLVNIIDPHQMEEQFGGTAPNCKDPDDFYPYRFFPEAGSTETKTLKGKYPVAYQSNGLLWEEHNNVPEAVRERIEKCSVDHFPTSSSCPYLSRRFNKSINPASDINAHFNVLNAMFPSTAITEQSTAITEQSPQSVGRLARLRSETRHPTDVLADAVVASVVGQVEVPEEIDRIQDEVVRRAEETSEAELVDMCRVIAEMVNSGKIASAVSMVKKHEDMREKVVHDGLALESVADTYHMLELKRKTATLSKSSPEPTEGGAEGELGDCPIEAPSEQDTTAMTHESPVTQHVVPQSLPRSPVQPESPVALDDPKGCMSCFAPKRKPKTRI